MPTTSAEDYLKAILHELETSERRRVPTGRLAERLGVSPGSVTAMLKSLSDRGLVEYERYAGVGLTESGARLALDVVRRHRLIELFLVEVLSMDWSEVHPEAERLEHHVSPRLLDRIDALLGHPRFDPHGDPIPLADGSFRENAAAHPLVASDVGVSRRVTRVADQSAKFLREMAELGIVPGAALTILRREGPAGAITLKVTGADGPSVRLTAGSAAKVWVS